MTREFHALERSLRDGPPDESGYLASALDLGTEFGPEQAGGTRRFGRAGSADRMGRPQALVPSSYLVAITVVAIAAGGLAIFGRLGTSGTTNASPRPIAVPALTETFVSPLNGFSLKHPAGWTVKPATVSWPPDVFLPVGNAALDDLRQPGEARLSVASQRLAADQTHEAWLAAFFRPYPPAVPCGTQPANSPRIPIDGQSGYLDQAGCPAPADQKFSAPDLQFDAIVFAGGRVYQFSLDGNVDLGYFKAILATVRLDPASAIDPSGG